MCKFFSFVGDGYGNFRFSDWATRKSLLGTDGNPDSHTFILRGVAPKQQDRWSRYEFNPLTGVFTVDQGVEGHDHGAAEKWVRSRDWSTIVEPLIIKPIVHPFKDRQPPKRITKAHIALVKEWASVRASVWDSVRSSVRSSAGASVWASVWASAGASVRSSVWDSVWASVRSSVRSSAGASVRSSVWDSVWDSVWAYNSSFFDIDYGYDYSNLNKLWNLGLVPSFDGKTWRLHGGPEGEVLWKGEI